MPAGTQRRRTFLIVSCEIIDTLIFLKNHTRILHLHWDRSGHSVLSLRVLLRVSTHFLPRIFFYWSLARFGNCVAGAYRYNCLAGRQPSDLQLTVVVASREDNTLSGASSLPTDQCSSNTLYFVLCIFSPLTRNPAWSSY